MRENSNSFDISSFSVNFQPHPRYLEPVESTGYRQTIFQAFNHLSKHSDLESTWEKYDSQQPRTESDYKRREEVSDFYQDIDEFKNTFSISQCRLEVPENIRARRVEYNQYYAALNDPTIAIEFVQKSKFLDSGIGIANSRFLHHFNGTPQKFYPFNLHERIEAWQQASTTQIVEQLDFPQRANCHIFYVFDSLFDHGIFQRKLDTRFVDRVEQGLQRHFHNRLLLLKQLKSCNQAQIIYIVPPVVGTNQKFWLAQINAFESVRELFLQNHIAVFELVPSSILKKLCGSDLATDYNYNSEGPLKKPPISASCISKDSFVNLRNKVVDLVLTWVKRTEATYAVPIFPPEIPTDYIKGDCFHFSFEFLLKRGKNNIGRVIFRLNSENIEEQTEAYARFLVKQTPKKLPKFGFSSLAVTTQVCQSDSSDEEFDKNPESGGDSLESNAVEKHESTLVEKDQSIEPLDIDAHEPTSIEQSQGIELVALEEPMDSEQNTEPQLQSFSFGSVSNTLAPKSLRPRKK